MGRREQYIKNKTNTNHQFKQRTESNVHVNKESFINLNSKPSLTRSKSSLGTISSFATFPWNFFDTYELTSLSQFWKIKLLLRKSVLNRYILIHAKHITYLSSSNVKIWLKREGHLITHVRKDVLEHRDASGIINICIHVQVSSP